MSIHSLLNEGEGKKADEYLATAEKLLAKDPREHVVDQLTDLRDMRGKLALYADRDRKVAEVWDQVDERVVLLEKLQRATVASSEG